jgi:MoaA/NifB/PqqE/SkfB family radical SAM enzyme
LKKISQYKRIRLEASSACQLHCPSCTTANNAIPAIGRGFLRSEKFRKLVEENRGIKEIELSNYGEICLNPDLLEIMKIAYANNITLRVDNGVNLNNVRPEVLEGFVKYRVKSITCSIDGASAETYAKYRVGGNYEAVIKHIETINMFKNQYRTNYPVLRWQFVVFGHNEHELSRARSLAKDLKMNFCAKLSWDSIFSPCSSEVAKREFHVSSREEYEKKSGKDYMQQTCHQLWDDPQINWDGRVLGCCMNYWKDFGGNVFDDGLVNALNNDTMQYARHMLLGLNDVRDDIPCATCHVYLTMKEQEKFLDRNFKKKIYNEAKRMIPYPMKSFLKKLRL